MTILHLDPTTTALLFKAGFVLTEQPMLSDQLGDIPSFCLFSTETDTGRVHLLTVASPFGPLLTHTDVRSVVKHEQAHLWAAYMDRLLNTRVRFEDHVCPECGRVTHYTAGV